MQKSISKRNANIELLRIISILMVTTLHALSKGKILSEAYPSWSVYSKIGWGFEAMSISAVNIFFLISGYFLIKSTFKPARLIELILQTVFYTVLSLIIGVTFGIIPSSEIGIFAVLNAVLPIHMDVYWFVTVYIIIYILSPLLNIAVNTLEKKKFELVLILLIVYECIIKSILPFKLEYDSRGYSLLWGLTVFLTGAYIRLYGIPLLNSFSRGMLVYFISVIAIFSEDVFIRFVYASSGRLENIIETSYSYNHLFVYAAAVGIFTAFISKKEMTGIKEKIILFLSPMTLGVYLAHENLTFRYEWPKWLGINDSVNGSILSFLFHLVGGILVVYITGSTVDYIRIKLFDGIKIILLKRHKKAGN